MRQQDVVDALEKALDKRSRIDQEKHYKHHEFIEAMIEQKVRRAQFISTIKSQVLGWGVVVVLGWIGKTVAKKVGFF